MKIINKNAPSYAVIRAVITVRVHIYANIDLITFSKYQSFSHNKVIK